MSLYRESTSLTSLSPLDSARITGIDHGIAGQLFGYGIYPGAVVELQQKFPGYVIKTDETEIALESGIASKIRVVRI